MNQNDIMTLKNTVQDGTSQLPCSAKAPGGVCYQRLDDANYMIINEYILMKTNLSVW